tara:strand:+ start:444 stop:689 length:246 start_codon:yes stop_codon:yes gene_type:complete
MYNLSKYLGIETYIYSKDDLYYYYLCDIKNNLKHTITLKKQFYIPSHNEIQNKVFMINLKKKNKIDVNELIKCKNNLKVSK